MSCEQLPHKLLTTVVSNHDVHYTTRKARSSSATATTTNTSNRHCASPYYYTRGVRDSTLSSASRLSNGTTTTPTSNQPIVRHRTPPRLALVSASSAASQPTTTTTDQHPSTLQTARRGGRQEHARLGSAVVVRVPINHTVIQPTSVRVTVKISQHGPHHVKKPTACRYRGAAATAFVPIIVPRRSKSTAKPSGSTCLKTTIVFYSKLFSASFAVHTRHLMLIDHLKLLVTQSLKSNT